MTQRELAQALGIARNNVTRWEAAEAVQPRVETLHQLASILGAPMEDLLEDGATDLARLRTTAGLSQAGLAAAAGIPRSTLSALERGDIATLDEAIADRLARALDASVPDISDAHATAVASRDRR